MAETAGLAALFNRVVKCFNYVQLGRNFGKGLQTSQVKLYNAGFELPRQGCIARPAQRRAEQDRRVSRQK